MRPAAGPNDSVAIMAQILAGGNPTIAAATKSTDAGNYKLRQVMPTVSVFVVTGFTTAATLRLFQECVRGQALAGNLFDISWWTIIGNGGCPGHGAQTLPP